MFAYINEPGSLSFFNPLNLPLGPIMIGTITEPTFNISISARKGDNEALPVRILNVTKPKAPFKFISSTCSEKQCFYKVSIYSDKAGDFKDSIDITYNNGYAIKNISIPLIQSIFAGSDLTATPEKNVLVVYNSASKESIDIKDYYITNRPGFFNVNVLGVAYDDKAGTNFEVMTQANFEKDIREPIYKWITEHREKSIKHIVLVRGIPPRVVRSGDDWGTDWFATASLSGLLADTYKNKKICVKYALPNIGTYEKNVPQGVCDRVPVAKVNAQPYLSYIFSPETHPGTLAISTRLDMGSLKATLAYIDKLKVMYSEMPMPSYFISAGVTEKYGTTYYLEDTAEQLQGWAYKINDELLSQKISSERIVFKARQDSYITTAKNVLGFFTWGANGGRGGIYPTDDSITFTGNSGWYVIQTAESFNGQRDVNWQGDYIQWFSKNAFGGKNYENTPVGAVAHAGEPGIPTNDPIYFSCWESGQLFIDCAWMSRTSDTFMMAIGDPWVRK